MPSLGSPVKDEERTGLVPILLPQEEIPGPASGILPGTKLRTHGGAMFGDMFGVLSNLAKLQLMRNAQIGLPNF